MSLPRGLWGGHGGFHVASAVSQVLRGGLLGEEQEPSCQGASSLAWRWTLREEDGSRGRGRAPPAGLESERPGELGSAGSVRPGPPCQAAGLWGLRPVAWPLCVSGKGEAAVTLPPCSGSLGVSCGSVRGVGGSWKGLGHSCHGPAWLGRCTGQTLGWGSGGSGYWAAGFRGCGPESWGLTRQGQGPHARPPVEPVGGRCPRPGCCAHPTETIHVLPQVALVQTHGETETPGSPAWVLPSPGAPTPARTYLAFCFIDRPWEAPAAAPWWFRFRPSVRGSPRGTSLPPRGARVRP